MAHSQIVVMIVGPFVSMHFVFVACVLLSAAFCLFRLFLYGFVCFGASLHWLATYTSQGGILESRLMSQVDGAFTDRVVANLVSQHVVSCGFFGIAFICCSIAIVPLSVGFLHLFCYRLLLLV